MRPSELDTFWHHCPTFEYRRLRRFRCPTCGRTWRRDDRGETLWSSYEDPAELVSATMRYPDGSERTIRVERDAPPNWEAIDMAIVVLNRVHKADPSVLPTLIAHRVPCNAKVRDDPTVQVDCRNEEGEHDKRSDGPCFVGLLGLINGLFGVDERSWGHITAEYDKRRRLVRFLRSKEVKRG